MDDPRHDPGVAACVAAVQGAVSGLPEGACTIETDVILPGGSRSVRARSVLGMTITPARSDAAELVLVIDRTGVAVLTGTGAVRSRAELVARRPVESSQASYHEELGAIVEAVVAGRIEDIVVLGRGDRPIRRITEITLGDGTVRRATSARRWFARARRRERTTYAGYA